MRATVAERDEQHRHAVAQRPAQPALVEGEHRVEGPLRRAVEPPVLRRRAPGRSMREHIIGVSVSDTSADIATATLSVTANSRKRRPTMPPMSRMGTKTARSETVIETMVKPICSAPLSAALNGGLAALDGAHDVLGHDDGVVDDEPGRDGERHQRQVVDAVAEQPHHAEGADERQRHRDAGHERGARPSAGRRRRRRRRARTLTTQRLLDVLDRGADRLRPVAVDLDVDGRRDRLRELRAGAPGCARWSR